MKKHRLGLAETVALLMSNPHTKFPLNLTRLTIRAALWHESVLNPFIGPFTEEVFSYYQFLFLLTGKRIFASVVQENYSTWQSSPFQFNLYRLQQLASKSELNEVQVFFAARSRHREQHPGQALLPFTLSCPEPPLVGQYEHAIPLDVVYTSDDPGPERSSEHGTDAGL